MGEYRILSFVGNGFDISALTKLGDGVTTSYVSFYNYFRYKYPSKMGNSLITQMKLAKESGRIDWSDFETLLSEQIFKLKKTDKDAINSLNQDLLDIQKAFSRFLNEVVDSDIIEKVSMLDSEIEEKQERHGYRSLSKFFGDLSESQYIKMKSHNLISNNDKVYFTFINFNYTALLDNYILLDKEQFDPSPHITSDNNFTFYTNPKKYIGHKGFEDPYCQLIPEVYHPHGYQDVPKSLLFGTEPDSCVIEPYDLRRKFIKSIWARSEELYGQLFENTKLFIIYGCSLGKSDNWWWKKIFTTIAEQNAELIIYNYGEDDEMAVKERFIQGCCIKDREQSIIDSVKENIYVICFREGSDLNFLQF